MLHAFIRIQRHLYAMEMFVIIGLTMMKDTGMEIRCFAWVSIKNITSFFVTITVKIFSSFIAKFMLPVGTGKELVVESDKEYFILTVQEILNGSDD
mgnify:CR=1 FL=1